MDNKDETNGSLKNAFDNPIEVPVITEMRVPPSKIGTDEFISQLMVQLNTGNSTWRTAAGLAVKLGVAAPELEKWLYENKDHNPFLVRKQKNSDQHQYASKERVDAEEKDPKTGIDKRNNLPIITSNERLALGQAMLLSKGLDGLVTDYSRDIATRDQEAYRVLLEALKNLEFFVKLFSRATNYKKLES